MQNLWLVWTIVLLLFEFIKNFWFWVFNHLRIREPLVLILWKNQNQRTSGPSYLRSLKELTVFMQELAMKLAVLWWVIWFFQAFWEQWLYTRTQPLIFWKIMVMNLNNYNYNCYGFILDFNNCRLVWTLEPGIPRDIQ